MVDLQADEVRVSIPWRAWGPEAFREATERDIPILLSISAVWCHWCHVMDESTYEDAEVIRRVATEVVPIRVDADRRPDLNHRYNLGGWPSTAFLTPDGTLLSGGTFMPTEEFLDVFGQVVSYYTEQRADLDQKLERRRKRRARIHELRHRLRGDVTPEIVDTVIEALKQNYERDHGGFGHAPKFPLPDTVDFGLAMGTMRSDGELLSIARKTLSEMAEGGMYDHVAGGFFRYSTTDDWSVPHFEKMLDGNARLMEVYLHAAQIVDQPLYWRTVREVQAFSEATLRTPEGAFGGSAVADERYYHLDAEARAERTPPAVDQTLLTDWNAMMISSYLAAAAVLEQPYLADLALEALEAIWARNFEESAGLAHYHDGAPHLRGLLTDQAWMGRALLDAYEYAGRNDYLVRAFEVMDIMRARLWDPDVGGFYDEPFNEHAMGRLQERLKLLDENAVAADLALRLHRLSGKEEYQEMVIGTLEAMAPLYKGYRHHAASYGMAVYRFTHVPLRLVMVGDPEAEATRALRMAALAIYHPNRVVESLHPVSDAERLQNLELPAEPAPALYVRQAGYTSAPVREPAQVRDAVQGVPA